jgi:GMP synthase (glutamine-hydrolysing)
MTNEKVLVIDFGGQYNQLIARRVREFNVYCEMYPYTISLEKIKSLNPIGIIFTGGPSSVTDEGAPRIDKGIFDLGIPVLGICYGAQLIAYTLNGKVEQAKSREYGKKEAL